MNEISNISNIPGLQVRSVGYFTDITKPQRALLQEIAECIKKQKPLNWDVVVTAYIKNRPTLIHQTIKRVLNPNTDTFETKWVNEEYDVLEEYNQNSSIWKYHTKPKLSTWFRLALAALVIKNKLALLPIFDIGDLDDPKPLNRQPLIN